MDKQQAKRKAIQLANKEFPGVHTGNCSCVHIGQDPMWWLDVPVDKAMAEGRYLLLLNHPEAPEKFVHIMDVPAEFFKEKRHFLFQGNVRGKEKFRIKLSIYPANKFQDVSGPGKISFSKFLVKTLYPQPGL